MNNRPIPLKLILIAAFFTTVFIIRLAYAHDRDHLGVNNRHYHGAEPFYQMVFAAGTNPTQPLRWHHHADDKENTPIFSDPSLTVPESNPSPPTPTPTSTVTVENPTTESTPVGETPASGTETQVPPPVQIEMPIADPTRVLATEWMLRDLGWRVPQWIEFWNANPVAIDLTGWTFEYATRKFANHPYIIHKVVLTEFSLPADEGMIFASYTATETTIPPEKVYSLNIDYVLKRGWRLTTADGTVVHAIGEAFTGKKNQRPPEGTLRGTWRDQIRVSYQHYKSGDPETPFLYGHKNDIGSPTYYDPVRAVPSLSKPKRITLWGKLKHESPL